MIKNCTHAYESYYCVDSVWSCAFYAVLKVNEYLFNLLISSVTLFIGNYICECFWGYRAATEIIRNAFTDYGTITIGGGLHGWYFATERFISRSAILDVWISQFLFQSETFRKLEMSFFQIKIKKQRVLISSTHCQNCFQNLVHCNCRIRKDRY